MPVYELGALLALGDLGPVVVGLIVLATVVHVRKGMILAYGVGMLVLLATVVASIGLHIYAVPLHGSWWGWMWWPDIIAAILTVAFGVMATITVLPELADD